MDPNALYYAFSTIAQCAAALAALFGFFGQQRLDRLQEILREVERAIAWTEQQSPTDLASVNLTQRAAVTEKSPSPKELRLQRQLTFLRDHRAAIQHEREHWRHVLVPFLIGTLAMLALAIVGLAFVDGLRHWVWLTRLFIIGAGLWLGGAPAYAVLQATDSARTMQQRWSRLWRRVQIFRSSALIIDRLRGQWRHVRARLWDFPWQYRSEHSWPTLQRWEAQVRTRIRRR